MLKEAIRAFDGTAIIVSHDREFLDGLVTKVYEFGGGNVREHIGGIYDFLHARKIADMTELEKASPVKETPSAKQNLSTPLSHREGQGGESAGGESAGGQASYAERKEQQRRQKRAEKAVEECEKKISKMEQRLKELDELLCDPKNASDMTLVTEYTDTKRQMDEEVERWEKLSEELQELLDA